MADWRAVLGLAADATLAQVAHAYRRQALRVHPDVSRAPDAAQRFIELTSAYREAVRELRGRVREPGVERPPLAHISFAQAYSGGQLSVEIEQGRGWRRLMVSVPPGAADGTMVEAVEEPALRVELAVDPSPLFSRLERPEDLLGELELELHEAALGTEKDVLAPRAKLRLKVPPGSQPEAVLKLAGEGMPRLNQDGRGDLYVRLRLLIPRSLSPRQRRLFEELDQESRRLRR